MRDVETIVGEVDSSMSMEGMPLYSEDKDRIRRYLLNPGNLEKIVNSLVEKHTVPIHQRRRV